MKLLQIIFFLCLASIASADSLIIDTAWSRTFGGPGNDYGNFLRNTSDNGFVICGQTNSFGAGNYDLWLIKIDSNGNKQWDKTFGGADDDYGNAVEQTADNGYIMCGYTWSYGNGNYDVWLVKTDSLGNKQWGQTFGGLAKDYASSVRQTKDGGYILCGCTWSFDIDGGDFWIIKTDSLGNEQWNKTFGGAMSDIAHSVIQTRDGNYIVCGETNSFGAGVTDAWLIRLDTLGNKLWSKTIGNVNYDIAISIIQLPEEDSGYIIGGYTWSYGTGNYDAWVIQTDSSGKKRWDRAYGGPKVDQGMLCFPTLDSGYAICGYTTSFGAGKYDAWLVKTDSTGVKQWERTFGDTTANVGLSALQTPDSGYVICGWTESEGAGMTDAWLLKTTKPYGVEESGSEATSRYGGTHLSAFPNPFTTSTTLKFSVGGRRDFPVPISFEIYDLSGSLVKSLFTGNKNAGQYSITWNGKDESGNKVPRGIYFCKLTAGKIQQTKKLTILR